MEDSTLVIYRVGYCRRCGHLLDVFANYTPDRRLRDIWPHLLGAPSPTSREITPYRAQGRVPHITHDVRFAWLFPPLLLLSILYDGAAASRALGPSGALNFLLTSRYGDLITRGGIPIVMAVMLLLRRQYIRLFSDQREFEKLFAIRESRGRQYWQNFALSRFIGAQRSGMWLSPNQVMVYGGLVVAGLLLVVWARALPGSVQRIATPGAIPGVSLVAEGIFWVVAAYFVGVGGWITTVIPGYILKGLHKVPMHLDPLDNFSNAEFLARIGIYSFLGFLTIIVCVVLLALLSLFVPASPGYPWLTLWAQLGLIYLQIIIAAISGSRRIRALLALTLLYSALRITLDLQVGVALVSLIGAALNTAVPDATVLYQYAELAILIFLAATTFNIQSNLTFSAFRRIKEEYKADKLAYYRAIAEKVEAELQELTEGKRALEAITTQRGQSLVSQLEAATNLCQKIDSAPVKPLLYRRIANVVGIGVPLVLAVVPIVLDLWLPGAAPP